MIFMCGEYDFSKVEVFNIFCHMEDDEINKIIEELDYVDYDDAWESGHHIFCKYCDEFEDNKEEMVSKLKGYDNYFKDCDDYFDFYDCTNHNCYHYDKEKEFVGWHGRNSKCVFFGHKDRLIDCFSDIFYDLVLCIELGGEWAIKDLKEKVGVDKDLLNWVIVNYHTKKGILEK